MFQDEIERKLYWFKNFIGVYARDTLPYRVQLPMALIVNTDKRSQPGTHWVAIYIDTNGVGEYFDSYGLPPLYMEFLEFLLVNAPNGYFCNKITLQCFDCVTCGKYCAAYCVTRLKGFTYAYFISLFTSNTYRNDELIKIYFDLMNHY